MDRRSLIASSGAVGLAGLLAACGKKEDTANLQDALTGKLIALARSALEKGASVVTDDLIVDALFMTITNVNFDNAFVVL